MMQAPLALQEGDGETIAKCYSAAVTADHVVLIPLDITAISDHMIFNGLGEGYPLLFGASDVMIYNTQGFLMQLLTPPNAAGIYAIEDPGNPDSMALTYDRHEFNTYREQHSHVGRARPRSARSGLAHGRHVPRRPQPPRARDQGYGRGAGPAAGRSARPAFDFSVVTALADADGGTPTVRTIQWGRVRHDEHERAHASGCTQRLRPRPRLRQRTEPRVRASRPPHHARRSPLAARRPPRGPCDRTALALAALTALVVDRDGRARGGRLDRAIVSGILRAVESRRALDRPRGLVVEPGRHDLPTHHRGRRRQARRRQRRRVPAVAAKPAGVDVTYTLRHGSTDERVRLETRTFSRDGLLDHLRQLSGDGVGLPLARRARRLAVAGLPPRPRASAGRWHRRHLRADRRRHLRAQRRSSPSRARRGVLSRDVRVTRAGARGGRAAVGQARPRASRGGCRWRSPSSYQLLLGQPGAYTLVHGACETYLGVAGLGVGAPCSSNVRAPPIRPGLCCDRLSPVRCSASAFRPS